MKEKLGWKGSLSAVGLLGFSLVVDEVTGTNHSVRAPLYALAAVILHAVIQYARLGFWRR